MKVTSLELPVGLAGGTSWPVYLSQPLSLLIIMGVGLCKSFKFQELPMVCVFPLLPGSYLPSLLSTANTFSLRTELCT